METDTNLFLEDVKPRMFFLSISVKSAQALDVRTVKVHIKVKWPKALHCIPNGYLYHFDRPDLQE